MWVHGTARGFAINTKRIIVISEWLYTLYPLGPGETHLRAGDVIIRDTTSGVPHENDKELWKPDDDYSTHFKAFDFARYGYLAKEPPKVEAGFICGGFAVNHKETNGQVVPLKFNGGTFNIPRDVVDSGYHDGEREMKQKLEQTLITAVVEKWKTLTDEDLSATKQFPVEEVALRTIMPDNAVKKCTGANCAVM